MIIEHFGDSILPYLTNDEATTTETNEKNEKVNLPIIVISKINCIQLRPAINGRFSDRQTVFPDSTLKGPRREIR